MNKTLNRDVWSILQTATKCNVLLSPVRLIIDIPGDKQVRAWLDGVTKSLALTYVCELA